MKALLQQSFNGHAVRVFGTADEPLFVAADVCGILELANVSQAVAALEDDEKGICSADTLGGPQKALCVTESGLYALIFKSRKPEAKAFRKWVTSEVLPAIRKTGKFAAPVQPELPGLTEKITELAAAVKLLRKTGVSPDLAAQIVADMLKPKAPEPAPAIEAHSVPRKKSSVAERLLDLIPAEGIGRADLVNLWIKETGGVQCSAYNTLKRDELAGRVQIDGNGRKTTVHRAEVPQ